MYPPLRIATPVLKTASFFLPDEGVAQPSPVLLIDASAGVVDIQIDTDLFIYASIMTVIQLDGLTGIRIVCPPGWRTNAGVDVDFTLPGSDTGGGVWSLYLDGTRKFAFVIAISFQPPSPTFLDFIQGPNGNVTLLEGFAYFIPAGGTPGNYTLPKAALVNKGFQIWVTTSTGASNLPTFLLMTGDDFTPPAGQGGTALTAGGAVVFVSDGVSSWWTQVFSTLL